MFSILNLGNGLYRAVSQALYIRDELFRTNRDSVLRHTDLRKKVAIEIKENQLWYDVDSPIFVSELAKEQSILLSRYSSYVEETPKDGTLSDINHIYALSSVINSPIQCYFPSTNPNNNPFQRIVHGRGVTDELRSKKIRIMWTSTSLPKPLRISNLIIDHFVPLIDEYDSRRYFKKNAPLTYKGICFSSYHMPEIYFLT